MVITLMTVMRGHFGMEHYITLNHMEDLAKILMLTGTLVGFAQAPARRSDARGCDRPDNLLKTLT